MTEVFKPFTAEEIAGVVARVRYISDISDQVLTLLGNEVGKATVGKNRVPRSVAIKRAIERTFPGRQKHGAKRKQATTAALKFLIYRLRSDEEPSYKLVTEEELDIGTAYAAGKYPTIPVDREILRGICNRIRELFMLDMLRDYAETQSAVLEEFGIFEEESREAYKSANAKIRSLKHSGRIARAKRIAAANPASEPESAPKPSAPVANENTPLQPSGTRIQLELFGKGTK